MGNNKKTYRINKVATEFNVSWKIIVEYLNQKGFEIEAKITAKLDEAMYQDLCSVYEKDNSFNAKDMYTVWSENCKSSNKSILVLSPYVDVTVKNLLSTNQIPLHVSKRIYTRVDSDTIFDNPYQIRTLIDCIKEGIAIYSIPDLHANALIIDNKYFSIGSQNFTAQGRKDKETSMMSKRDFISSKYFETIESWLDEAEEVKLEYLLKLESKLKFLRTKIENLKKEHKSNFDEIPNKSEIRRLELIRNLLFLKSRSNTQFESEYIFLKKTFIDTRESSLYTYLADSRKDLRKWKVKGEGNSAALIRLKYYPCVQTSNNSISFVRLAKTRISFFLTWIGLGSYAVGDVVFTLSINCPQQNTDKVNFQIILKNVRTNRSEGILDFYFDGSDFHFVNGTFSEKYQEMYLMKNLIENNIEKKKIIEWCFRGHNMATIGEGIDEFFDGSLLKLYIVEYLENPIIIAEKQ